MIPSSTLESINQYVQSGVPPSGFLYAVLSNNLRESYRCADEDNREALFEIVSYLWNKVPATCWGNPERVRHWLVAHELSTKTGRPFNECYGQTYPGDEQEAQP